MDHAPVAQWIEHRSSEPRVGGSNPFGRTTIQVPIVFSVVRIGLMIAAAPRRGADVAYPGTRPGPAMIDHGV